MKLVKNRTLKLINEVELPLYEHEGEYYIDGEDLWKWLGVKTQFTKWMQRRIEQYKLISGGLVKNDKTVGNADVEQFDYLNLEQKTGNSRAKRKYFLLPDTVKSLAMVEDAEKGKLVRKFYLDLEKYVNETNQMKLFKEWRKTDAEQRRYLHDEIGDDRDCIRLSNTLNYLTAYIRKLPKIYKKDELYKRYVKGEDKESWVLYLSIQEKAIHFTETFMAMGVVDLSLEVCKLLLEYYIADPNDYKRYIKEHKSRKVGV